MRENNINDRIVGLIHLIEWGLKEKCFNLSKGIRLCELQGSKIKDLYKEMVENELFDDDEIDSGYFTFIEIDNGLQLKWNYPYIGAFEHIDLICSIIGISFSGYVDLSYILHISTDRKKIYHIQPILYMETRPMVNWLVENQPIHFEIDIKIKDYLKNSWKYIWKGVKEGKFNRLFNAVRLYYLASSSLRASEALLHLVIIWETIFAPYSHSEISHQVSMNLCKFLKPKKEERKSLYKKLKKIYDDRSKIIHGGIPKNEERLFKNLEFAFVITAKALYKIFSSSELSNIFIHEDKKRDFLDDLNF